MPVKDKVVSVRWDARHTYACKTSTVWRFGICLFPALLSFTMLISIAPLTGCRMLSETLHEDEWYNWIFFFFSVIVSLSTDVLKQIVYTSGLSSSHGVTSAAEQHLYLKSLIGSFAVFLRDWNVRHLFLYLPFSFCLSPDFYFIPF